MSVVEVYSDQSKTIQVAFNEKKKLRRNFKESCLFDFKKKRRVCYKMMVKKTYIIQENAKRLAVKKNEVVCVGRNKWAANLRGKKYTFMYMYKEEKKN